MSKIDTIIDNLQEKEMWPVDPSRFIRDQHDYIMAIRDRINSLAADYKTEGRSLDAELVLKCLEVE